MILQRNVPYPALSPRALPSLQVMDAAEWLIFDEAEAGQIALRARLMAERREHVFAALPGSEPAQDEAVNMIGAHLGAVHGRARPQSFEALAISIQEDVVILEPRAEGHVMVAAILCFPASWMLSEKMGRTMARIHDPVEEIGPRMDRQIERVFQGLRAGRPLWRYNQLWYHDPALFQLRSAFDPRERPVGEGDFLRTERQVLTRMPQTGCVMFTIHTYVVARADVERAGQIA